MKYKVVNFVNAEIIKKRRLKEVYGILLEHPEGLELYDINKLTGMDSMDRIERKELLKILDDLENIGLIIKEWEDGELEYYIVVLKKNDRKIVYSSRIEDELDWPLIDQDSTPSDITTLRKVFNSFFGLNIKPKIEQNIPLES